MKTLIITIALALLIGCNSVKTESRSSVTLSCAYAKWNGDYQYVDLYVLDDGIEIVSVEEFSNIVHDASKIQTPSPVLSYYFCVQSGSTVQVRYKYGISCEWLESEFVVECDTSILIR